MNLLKKIFNKPKSSSEIRKISTHALLGQEDARIILDQQDASDFPKEKPENKLFKETEEKTGRQISDIPKKKPQRSRRIPKFLQIPFLILLIAFFGVQSYKNIQKTGFLPQNVFEKFTNIKNQIVDIEKHIEEKIHDVAAKIPSIQKSDFALDYQGLLDKLDNYNTASVYLAQKLDKYKYSTQNFGEDKIFDDVHHLVGKVSQLPRVQEKINIIFQLNQTLSKQYEDAAKIQSRVEKIREKFHKKVDDIQVFRQEVLDALNGVQAFSEELKTLKKEKISLLNQYQQTKYNVERGQIDYQSFVDRFEDLIQQESLDLKSPLNSLESEIKRKNTLIQSLYDENQKLESDIAVFQERIRKLNELIHDDTHALSQPDNAMTSQIKSSINQFKNIANELASIKNQSLKGMQESLTNSIQQLHRMQSTELTDLSTDQIENLENKINKEKSALKRRASQQFTTLEFSTREIRKNEDRLKHLEAQLETNPPTQDFENYGHIIPRQIENFSNKIAEAKEKISQNNLKLKDAKEWISERRKLHTAALQLQISISDLDNVLKIKDEELEIFQDDVRSKEKEFTEKDKISQEYKKITQTSTKQLVKKINKRISDYPQPDELEEELRIFQHQLEEAQNTINSIRKIFDEIKSLL